MKKNIINKFRRYFTLVELLVVMAILAVLMGIGVGVFSYANRRMAEAKTTALIKKLEIALESYKKEYGYYLQYPTQASYFYLDAHLTDPAGSNNLEKFLPDYQHILNKETEQRTHSSTSHIWVNVMDGFGMPLLYSCPGKFNRMSFDICSMGADAKPGVADDPDTGSGSANQDGGISGSNVEYIDDAILEARYGDDITNFGKAN